MRGPWTSERLVLLREMLWALEGATAVDNSALTRCFHFMDPSGYLSDADVAQACRVPALSDHREAGQSSPERLCDLRVLRPVKGHPTATYQVIAWSLLEPVLPDARTSVYFIQAGPGGAIKIGTTASVATRVAALQTGNAAPLQILAFIPGGRLMESTLHARFAASRLNGEWFRPTPDLVDLIAELGGKVA